MSKKLKQCPFCGGDAEIQDRGRQYLESDPEYVTVKCSMCGAGTKLFLYHNMDKAITAWNRRV